MSGSVPAQVNGLGKRIAIDASPSRPSLSLETPLQGNAIKLRGRLKGVSSPRVSKGLILLALPHHRATDTQLNLMALPLQGLRHATVRTQAVDLGGFMVAPSGLKPVAPFIQRSQSAL
jgi:hypothetical protein